MVRLNTQRRGEMGKAGTIEYNVMTGNVARITGWIALHDM